VLKKSLEWSSSETGFSDIIMQIKDECMWFRKMTIKYKKSNNYVMVNCSEGRKTPNIPPIFIENMTNYLMRIEKWFNVFFKQINTSFEIVFRVDSSGKFDLDDISIKIHADVSPGINVIDLIRKPFAIFAPFYKHIENMWFNGHRHKLVYLLVDIQISEKELINILENPQNNQKILDNWYLYASISYERAKETFQYVQCIPCNEGILIVDAVREDLNMQLRMNL